MPKISIIVPVYKVEEYLPRCIDSILDQTFTDFELILIDDGSPDNCGAICDEYAAKDNRIVVIHKENAGVSAARNDGLDISKGKYISFVDSDDVIHPQFYEIMLGTIDDADLCFCQYTKFHDKLGFLNIQSPKREIYEDNEIFNLPNLTIYMIWNKLIKKAVINELRFDVSLKNAEDSLFAFECMTKCKKVVFVDEIMYGYFIRNNGAVANIDIDGKKNIVEIWSFIYEKAKTIQSKKLIANCNEFLIYSYVNLFYSSLNIDKEINKTCKKFLLCNVCNILMNKKLTIKEKMLLFLKLVVS